MESVKEIESSIANFRLNAPDNGILAEIVVQKFRYVQKPLTFVSGDKSREERKSF
jgi:hypothetical protein